MKTELKTCTSCGRDNFLEENVCTWCGTKVYTYAHRFLNIIMIWVTFSAVVAVTFGVAQL